MTAYALNHVCFTVSNLRRSVNFWSQLLGYEPERLTEYAAATDAAVTGYLGVKMEAAYFQLPNDVLLELFVYQEPPSTEASSMETYVVGNGHLGLVVDDVGEYAQRARSAGGRLRSERPIDLSNGEHAGGRAIYVRDPDGITIELLELPTSTLGDETYA
jgi:catechol 2,3-dioxygenase-like lactoylglutathione lyase family enzyme